MKLKNFKSYADYYSKDPINFEKKIALASSGQDHPLFENFSTFDDAITAPKSVPVIIWGNFRFSSMNENFCSVVYNQGKIPSKKEIASAFQEEEFIPKTVRDRSLIKKMNFPITGVSGEEEEDFNTYGRFKKSERQFDHFKEKLVPTSKFEVLVVDGKPIHAHKKIINTSFDVDLTRWKHLGEAESICKKIYSKYSPDFYVVSLLESKGGLYLDSITRNVDLTPVQSVRLYEAAYRKYYETELPYWFRKKIFEDHIKPYYVKKYYDSLLFKPTGTIDFEKYLS